MKHLVPRKMLHWRGTDPIREQLRFTAIRQFPAIWDISPGILGSSGQPKELLTLLVLSRARLREDLRSRQFFSAAGPMSNDHEVTS